MSQVVELVYEELKNQYNLERKRWDELNNKASTLFGFSGIIDTIIFGVFMLIISDESFRTLILNSKHSCLICSLMITGFVSYIVATMIFLWSFRVQKHAPAPYIKDYSVLDKLFEKERELLKVKKVFSSQYLNGYQQNHKKVKKMYDQILIGTLFLLLAIMISFAIAIIILFGVILA